jgi:outer membrane protein
MKNKLLLTVLSLFLTGAAFQAGAQTNPKLGYTNLDYILGLLPEAKQVETDIQTYEKQLQTQLQSKYADYEKKLKDYQEASSKGLMTDVIKEDKEKELMSMQNSIKEFEQSAQSSLQKKQVSLLEPVLAKVQKAIDAVGAENDYSYIFSTHADYGGSAIILYAKSKEDNISDLVLKKLGVTPPPPGATGDTKNAPAAGTGTTAPVKTDANAGKTPGTTAPVKKTK